MSLCTCLSAICVCVLHESSDSGVVPVILCNHEGRETVQQFFSHFVKSISTKQLQLLLTSLISSQWDRYATLLHHLPVLYSTSCCLLLFPSRTLLCCIVGSCILNGFLLLRLFFLASLKQLKELKQPSESHSNWFAKLPSLLSGIQGCKLYLDTCLSKSLHGVPKETLVIL